MLQQLFAIKDKNFLPLLQEHARKIEKAGSELFAMLQTKEPLRREEKKKTIAQLEIEGDQCVHDILQKLYQVFFAPYDHEDIKNLVLKLDEILDEIDCTCSLIDLYRPENGEKAMEAFGETIQKTTSEIAELLGSLKNRTKCRVIFDKLDNLEHISDRILSEAIYELFKTEKDALTIMKYKEIYERLERIVDRCKHASDVIETIVLKYM